MEEFKEELRSLLRKYSINNTIKIGNNDEAVADFLIKTLTNLNEFNDNVNDESNDYYLDD